MNIRQRTSIDRLVEAVKQSNLLAERRLEMDAKILEALGTQSRIIATVERASRPWDPPASERAG